MKLLLVCFVTVFSLVCTVPVHAALFEGQQVRLTYELPSLGSIFDTRTFTVGAGVEASNFPTTTGVPLTNIDFSDFNIFVTYLSATTWTALSFNGFHVFDMNGTIPAFTSISINPATNMSGLDASRITFDAENIYVNWNDLFFAPSTIVSLDINSQTVPEPSAMLLLGSGLIGLVGLRRRLKK